MPGSPCVLPCKKELLLFPKSLKSLKSVTVTAPDLKVFTALIQVATSYEYGQFARQ